MAHRNLFASKNLDVPERLVTQFPKPQKDRRVIWRLSRSYLLLRYSTRKSSDAAIVLMAASTSH